jgi:DNA-binding ferritin-like protein (Dps family)
MEARTYALPRDDRIRYGEIKPYLWKCTPVTRGAP